MATNVNLPEGFARVTLAEHLAVLQQLKDSRKELQQLRAQLAGLRRELTVARQLRQEAARQAGPAPAPVGIPRGFVR